MDNHDYADLAVNNSDEWFFAMIKSVFKKEKIICNDEKDCWSLKKEFLPNNPL